MRVPIQRRDFLKSTLAVGVSGLLLAQARSVSAETVLEPNADCWLNFRNSLSNLGVSKTTLPENPKLLWELASPDGITSTPVIADGKTYIGTLSGDLLCLDLETGRQEWKYVTVENAPKNTLPPGFNSPLTLGKELVYAGDDAGTMHAVERATGKLKWKFDSRAEIVGGSVLQHRGADMLDVQLIFGSHAEKIFAIETSNGELLWEFETHGPVNGTPTVSDHFSFVTGCSEPLMYVVDLNTGLEADKVPLTARLIASAAELDGILYFGSDEGAVYALDWNQKKLVWEYSVPDREYQIESSPAVTEKVVVIGSQDKHLHCIDRLTGKGIWEFRTRAKVDSSPVIVGDRVYFGSGDKNLYGLSLADGKEVWRYNAGQGFTGSPAVAAGKLVVGTDSANGRVLCFG